MKQRVPEPGTCLFAWFRLFAAMAGALSGAYLGTEAIRRIEVENFPAIVVNDCHGGDLYQEGMAEYAR